MTYSTLTWFSNSIKPSTTSELFLVSVRQNNGDFMVFGTLYEYDLVTDEFYVPPHFDYGITKKLGYLKRSQISYWAYVPRAVDLKHGLGKQSQIPEEK